ncbi:Eukaryotic initiation factor 4E incomplete domain containing protein [Pandoravirus dulcis]|uniref:Eukaryotic initiation factor 4E incomplete domain containing protein n=1 Tax=Pandoravirus dulcis TaxID=1349409 RepID=S4VWY2_9VIRU|nr:Eukaryotic initiation factor 4E incomplete domain containing protein [Pandoravirus dulcis]AGO82571.1 Eukaryotic initiation factor 4E incomplete domain containing protein [Pandoravirus dulcis]
MDAQRENTDRQEGGGRAWCVWSHATAANRKQDYTSTRQQATDAPFDRLDALWGAIETVLPHGTRSGGVSVFEEGTSPDWESPSNVGGATAAFWWRAATPDAHEIYQSLVSAVVVGSAPLSTRIKGVRMTLSRGAARYQIWVARHDAPHVSAHHAADRLMETPRQHALALVPWFRALVRAPGTTEDGDPPMSRPTPRDHYYDVAAEEQPDPDVWESDPFGAVVFRHG